MGAGDTGVNCCYFLCGPVLSERMYILPKDHPSCATAVIINGSFLMSDYMYLKYSMQHLFDHPQIVISDCHVKR